MEASDEEHAVLVKPRTASQGAKRAAAAAATRRALLYCYWTLGAVTVIPIVILALARGAWRRLAESTVSCTGDGAETRRCVFTNAIVHDGVIWLYSRRGLEVPPMLCSAVNIPDVYRHLCDVRVSNDAKAFRRLVGRAKNHRSFDVAVALYRLNPTNAYHAIWEDMLPALGMMRRGADLAADPKGALRQLRASRWGLAVVDGLGPELLDKGLWRQLLPEVAVAHPGQPPVWAAKLLAGTVVGCAHWGHCAPRNRPAGTLDPPDTAGAFRALVFNRFGIQEGPWLGREEGAIPRVTIVQRAGTRRLRNLDDVVQIVREEMDVEPMVVDMANMTVLEQVTVAHNTDIFILVHGGALANTMWLPHAALLIDIYPYAFPVSEHSNIVHWMRAALRGVGLGHHPFPVLSSEGQELVSGPVTPNCTCIDDGGCQALTFASTLYVTVEAERFRKHVKEGLELWRDGRYPAPIDPAEFEKRAKAEFVPPAENTPRCV